MWRFAGGVGQARCHCDGARHHGNSGYSTHASTPVHTAGLRPLRNISAEIPGKARRCHGGKVKSRAKKHRGRRGHGACWSGPIALGLAPASRCTRTDAGRPMPVN
ncbi:hypothetical protein NH44784_059151 [Achromobacter xylosoxidans NH44784-1996]|nr:hypothetical protein NH44784_059151 [Achromobacter xylosoxidans NH44784-1996]